MTIGEALKQIEFMNHELARAQISNLSVKMDFINDLAGMLKEQTDIILQLGDELVQRDSKIRELGCIIEAMRNWPRPDLMVALDGTGCETAMELRRKCDWAMTQIEMRVFKFNGHCPFCERTIWECNSNAVDDCEWKMNYYEARL